jgi:hypothetical protein
VNNIPDYRFKVEIIFLPSKYETVSSSPSTVKKKKVIFLLSTVMLACSPVTWEAEKGKCTQESMSSRPVRAT